MSRVNWDKTTRFCLWCGEAFEPNSPNHVYCSDKCRKRGTAKLKQEEKEYSMSPNMMKIMEMVKDDPNYARAQIKEMKNGTVNRR